MSDPLIEQTIGSIREEMTPGARLRFKATMLEDCNPAEIERQVNLATLADKANQFCLGYILERVETYKEVEEEWRRQSAL